MSQQRIRGGGLTASRRRHGSGGGLIEPVEARLLLTNLLTAQVFTNASLTTPGLVGSYVNQSLRGYAPQNDWRTTQPIAGTRVDADVDFPGNSMGARAAVGLTWGTDANWDNFSVQWDGYLRVNTDGTRLATVSDDGSRMWVDLNNDGAFDASGAEFVNNNWGAGQGARPGERSAPIPAGTYRLRIQYEDGNGNNSIRLFANAGVPLNSASWTPVGPAPVINGWLDQWSATGRIRTLAASPTDPNVIYIGGAAGGVWKTTDAGAHWSPLTDFQATLNSGSIAVAPSNPNVVYVGTGEPTHAGGANPGKGVLKSTDGGAHWALLGQSVFDGQKFYKVAVSPTDPNTVYAAGAYFLRKSTDGGATWNDIHGTITNVDEYTDLAVDPNNPQTLYVAAGTSYYGGKAGHGVYKSTDGGATWNVAGNFPMGAQNGRIVLGLSRANSGVVYASVAQVGSAGGNLLRMMKSTDGGATWNQLTATPNYLGGQGWYDSSLIVSPTNANVVFAGGQYPFIETTDGGATWTDISTGAGQTVIHPDHHGIGFDANGRLLDGNDGGIYRLDNPTVGSIRWTNLNGDLQITDVGGGIALHPTDPGVAWGGGQDNGLVQSVGSTSWVNRYLGDAGDVLVDFSTPTTLYQGNVDRSDDGGSSFSPHTTGINTAEPGGALAMDPSNSSRLIYGKQRVYQTLNRADNWSPISTVGLNGWNITDGINRVAVARTSPGTIYVTAGPHVMVTSDNGATWQQRDVPAAGGYNALLVDPTNNLVAYVVTNDQGTQKVFRTANGGITWVNSTGNLPTGAVYDIDIDPRNGGRLFVCNDTGVYVTANRGTSWSRMGSALPNAQVLDLEVNTTLNILAAGTHGRGMWEISLDNVAPAVVAANFVYQTAPNALTFAFSEDVSARLSRTGLTVTPLPAGTQVTPIGYAYDKATNLATFTFAAPLADGNYRATFATGAVADPAGNALPGGYAFDFFVLAGDANRDRTVNFSDLAILAQNYNKTGKTFSQGDFNYDGTVNFSDLALLAQRYNTILSPPPVAPSPAAERSTDSSSTRSPDSLFSLTPISRPLTAKPKPVRRPPRR